MTKYATTCRLEVLTVLTEPQIEELAPLLESMMPSDPDVPEALRLGSVIEFAEVYDGDLNNTVSTWMRENEIAFIWAWDRNEALDLDPGLTLFDMTDGTVVNILMHSQQPCIPLAQAADPARVAKYKRQWDDIQARRAARAKQ